MALRTLMTQTIGNQRRIRWLETISMFDFDIQHIQGPENILADVLSWIYNGVKDEELTKEDYLQEEQKYLNTDAFLPKDSSSYMPYFTSNYNNNLYITIPLTPSPEPPIIPGLRRQNATLLSEQQPPMTNNISTPTSQVPTSAHANLFGLTRLPIGDGCTAAPIFWEDCNATGRCEAHLANHIDSYSHQLDGLPKRTFSIRPNSPSSTTTEKATPERIPQDALPPWRHPNFPLAPTNTPVQDAYQAHVTANSANGADDTWRLLWQYIQTGRLEGVLPGIEVQSADPPQDKQKPEQRQFGHVNPELLLVPDRDPIQYVEWPEFREEWEVRSVQLAPTSSAVPLTSQEEVNSQAITSGQKRKQEEERFVGEGRGKNKNLDYVNLLSDSDMDGDEELSDSEEFVDSGMKDKDKRKVDEDKGKEGEKEGGKEDGGQGKGMEQEEETDVDDEYNPHVNDDTVNEPNFIWNENKETSWGKCYFKALEDDQIFGNGKVIHHPFYRNVDGFILNQYPSEGQYRVYIPDGRCKIGSEFYSMCILLIHSAHNRLVHYGISKTYRDISKDTIWPRQWKETKRFVKGCHTCQIIKQPTQCPAGSTQMMQVPERSWWLIGMDVLGPFPPSKGFEHVLVVVDEFSSLIRLVPMKKKYTTRDIVDALICKDNCYHGIPHEIISD